MLSSSRGLNMLQAAKTLQQLIEKINTDAQGTVLDLAGCSYKSSKGWLSGLPTLTSLSVLSRRSMQVISTRTMPPQLSIDDNRDMPIAPEELQLCQTSIHVSEPRLNARAIFQLQQIPDPSRKSTGASKLLHVASAHTSVTNGKLCLPAEGQLVLGPECQQLEFKDMTIKGVIRRC